MALFDKPTIGEYEEALRKATPIEVMEELFLDEPLYRAPITKEIKARAKWAQQSPLKWMFCELKAALEKYEDKSYKKTEETITDRSINLHEKNQARAVQAPFFGTAVPPNTTKQ
jgi:hypothetical protein